MNRNRQVSTLVCAFALFLAGCEDHSQSISGERDVGSCAKKTEFDHAVCLMEAGQEAEGLELIVNMAKEGDLSSKQLIAGSFKGSDDEQLNQLADEYAAELGWREDEEVPTPQKLDNARFPPHNQTLGCNTGKTRADLIQPCLNCVPDHPGSVRPVELVDRDDPGR